MKNLVVTYLYPNALKYLDGFLKTLNTQTTDDFDILFFLDIVDKRDCWGDDRIKAIFIEGKTPIEIRFNSLKYLKNIEYENIIFCDFDDTMTNNRIQVLSNLLEKYEVVCNDLNIMQSDDEIIEYKIWGKRLGDNFEFNSEFISNKNIIGLGNTAIKSYLLKQSIKNSKLPLAADWFIFQQIINQSTKLFFTSECQTNYRQHNNNIAGIKKANFNRVKKIIDVKIKHYAALEEIGIFNYKPQKEKTELILNSLEKYEYNKPSFREFWWEETEYLNEKD